MNLSTHRNQLVVKVMSKFPPPPRKQFANDTGFDMLFGLFLANQVQHHVCCMSRVVSNLNTVNSKAHLGSYCVCGFLVSHVVVSDDSILSQRTLPQRTLPQRTLSHPPSRAATLPTPPFPHVLLTYESIPALVWTSSHVVSLLCSRPCAVLLSSPTLLL